MARKKKKKKKEKGRTVKKSFYLPIGNVIKKISTDFILLRMNRQWVISTKYKKIPLKCFFFFKSNLFLDV